MKNMKVKAKLITSFAIVVLLAIAVGLVGIIGMSRINAADDKLYTMNLLAISAMADFRETFQLERTKIREMIMSVGDEQAVESVAKSFEEYEKIIASAMLAYEATIVDKSEETAYYSAKDVYYGDYAQVKRDIHNAALAGDYDLAYRIMSGAGSVVAAISSGLQSSADMNDTLAKEAVDANTRLFTGMTILEAGILLFAVVVSIIMALYIAGLIGKPLGILTAFMNRAGTEGDISLSKQDLEIIKVYSLIQDEIGQCIKSSADFIRHILAISEELEAVASGDLSIDIRTLSDKDALGVSVSRMVDNLTTMFSEINASSDHVSSGSKQIADGAQSLAQGSTQQASAVEQLSSSINEVSDSIQRAADSARGAAEKAGSIRNKAEQGAGQMNAMLEAVQEINDASQSIGKVISVIDNIAFQTNILALNAAVEAARAGQHGRGFAVVAEEVRALAGKSADAAKETSVLIQNSIKKAELGAQLAADTNASLQEIVAGINETNTIVNDIAIASEQQAMAIKQINTGIEQVAQVVQQNSATAEQSAAASEEMSGQSVVLQDLIGQFKLRDSGSRRMSAAAPAATPARRLSMPAPSTGTTTAYAPSQGGYGKY